MLKNPTRKISGREKQKGGERERQRRAAAPSTQGSISTTMSARRAAGASWWGEDDACASLEQEQWNWMHGAGCASRMEKKVFTLAGIYFPWEETPGGLLRVKRDEGTKGEGETTSDTSACTHLALPRPVTFHCVHPCPGTSTDKAGGWAPAGAGFPMKNKRTAVSKKTIKGSIYSVEVLI